MVSWRSIRMGSDAEDPTDSILNEPGGIDGLFE